MNDFLLKNRAIFNIDDIRNDFKSKSSMCETLRKQLELNRIYKLKGGLYAAVDPVLGVPFVNRYEIATALYKDGYVAYHTALEYYGLATQIFYDVHIIAPKQYPSVEIDGLEYQCFISKYNEGVKEERNYAKICVTDVERTILDCINKINVAGGLEEVVDAIYMIKYLNEEKLLNYLEGFNIKVLYKKVGYLFQYVNPSYISNKFYKICKERISKRKDYLTGYMDEEYNKEWMIYHPKYITNEEF